jgi:hypothetical protein
MLIYAIAVIMAFIIGNIFCFLCIIMPIAHKYHPIVNLDNHIHKDDIPESNKIVHSLLNAGSFKNKNKKD